MARRRAHEDTTSGRPPPCRLPVPASHTKKGLRRAQAFRVYRWIRPAQNDATIEPLNCFLMNSFTSGDWYALTSFFTHG